MVKKQELVSYLDDYLDHSTFTKNDSSKNGLQVDNQNDEVSKIAFAVDSTSYLIDQAIEQKADMLIPHHGMFWGYDLPLTGIMYERTKKLLDNDLALYASHLPLDAHPEVGNNIGIAMSWCELFGIDDYELERFGEYNDIVIGFGVRHNKGIPVKQVTKKFCPHLKLRDEFYNFGEHKEITSFAVLTGGGGTAMTEAAKSGYDLFLTGEMVHRQTTYAKELKQSILLGGHYETETMGVQLLAVHLEEKFDVETVFIDEAYE